MGFCQSRNGAGNSAGVVNGTGFGIMRRLSPAPRATSYIAIWVALTPSRGLQTCLPRSRNNSQHMLGFLRQDRSGTTTPASGLFTVAVQLKAKSGCPGTRSRGESGSPRKHPTRSTWLSGLDAVDVILKPCGPGSLLLEGPRRVFCRFRAPDHELPGRKEHDLHSGGVGPFDGLPQMFGPCLLVFSHLLGAERRNSKRVSGPVRLTFSGAVDESSVAVYSYAVGSSGLVAPGVVSMANAQTSKEFYGHGASFRFWRCGTAVCR